MVTAAAPPRTPRLRRVRGLIAALLLGCIAVQVASANRAAAPTRDEPRYLGLGVYLLRHARWDVAAALLHPPLVHYLTSLPLLPLDLPDATLRIGDGNR